MTRDEAFEVLAAAIRRIAPEADLAATDPDAELAEEVDLDSMDMVHLVEELHTRTGLEIPERDQARLATITDALDYLVERSG